jgi:hypothetical protein
MPFTVEKCVSLVECYLKTQTIKTAQSDYSHQFGYPASTKSVKIILADRRYDHTKMCSLVDIVTETYVVEVSERLSAHLHKSLQKLE